MSREWEIDRVCLGDGTSDQSGISLKKGQLYESDSIHGGNETFSTIVPETLNLFKIIPKVRLSTKKGINKKKMGEIKKQKADRQKKILQTLEKKPGVKLQIGNPGARNQIVDVRKYQVQTHGLILATATEGSCVAASLINAIGEAKYVAVVERDFSKLSEMDCKSVAGAKKILHGL